MLARLVMSSARSIAGIITALYLAAEGFSAVTIGLLFVCVTVSSALMSTGIGLFSDRVGRKPFLVVVPMLAAVAALLFAEVRTPAALFLAAALGTFGRGAGAGGGTVGPYQPAESALVTESVPSSQRQSAFGRLAFMSSLGALIGSLLAELAGTRAHLGQIQATAVYRPAFLAAAVLAAAAGVLALWLREPGRNDSNERHNKVAGNRGDTAYQEGNAGLRRGAGQQQGDRPRRLRWPRRSWPALWRFWVTNSINGVAVGMVGPYVSYWLYRRYGVGPGTVGLLFAVVNLGSLVSTLSAARIARQVGTVRTIVAVRAITGVLLVPMALAPAYWIAGAIYLLRMLIQRVGLPLRQSYTQDLADPSERASLAALSNLPMQATMGGSQALAGYLFDEVSLAAPFELAAVFQCLNAFVYTLLFVWKPPTSARQLSARQQPPPA
ncbi:MAG: MFS transporter [Solirubrobacteraceae bacterium]